MQHAFHRSIYNSTHSQEPRFESSSPSTVMTPNSSANSERSFRVFDEQQYPHKTFELKSILKQSPRQLDTSPHSSEDESDDNGYSDEEEKDNNGRHRRPSGSTVQSFTLYTPDEERAVVKKLDRRLVLFVALLYMLSFLDRSSTYLKV